MLKKLNHGIPLMYNCIYNLLMVTKYNQILALLENCNLDNATGDVINEIVENLNKIYIWVLEKMTKKIKHQTDVMILSPVVQMYVT